MRNPRESAPDACAREKYTLSLRWSRPDLRCETSLRSRVAQPSPGKTSSVASPHASQRTSGERQAPLEDPARGSLGRTPAHPSRALRAGHDRPLSGLLPAQARLHDRGLARDPRRAAGLPVQARPTGAAVRGSSVMNALKKAEIKRELVGPA